jgi:hypothetical protein
MSTLLQKRSTEALLAQGFHAANSVASVTTGAARRFYAPAPMGPVEGMAPVNELGTPRLSPREVNAMGPARVEPTGAIRAAVDFNDISWLLRSMFGAPVRTGTGPNFIDSYASGALQLPLSTIQLRVDDDFRVAHRCAFNEMRFGGASEDGFRMIDFAYLARQVEAAAAAQIAAPTAAPTTREVLPARVMPTVTLNGVTSTLVESISVQVSNNLERKYLAGGDGFTQNYVVGDVTVSGEMTLMMTGRAMTNLFDAWNSSFPIIARWAMDGALGANRYLELQIPNAHAVRPDIPLGDSGTISMTVPFTARGSGTQPCIFVIHGTGSAAIT